jgi:hypothetical protein
MTNYRKLTQAELLAEARQRFGHDPMKFAFKCPSCGDVATLQDFKDAGAAPSRAGQECIGRLPGATRGCNWAAYGLIRGPWEVVIPADGDRPEQSVWGFPLAPPNALVGSAAAQKEGVTNRWGKPHVLIIETIEPITDDNGVVLDRNYEVSIECPGVTDACAEWVECSVAGCTVPREYNHEARDALGHGAEHRWFRELSIWGVRSGFCFVVNHGHGVGGEVAERSQLGVGPYEVEPEFEDGSLQDLVLVGERTSGAV